MVESALRDGAYDHYARPVDWRWHCDRIMRMSRGPGVGLSPSARQITARDIYNYEREAVFSYLIERVF